MSIEIEFLSSKSGRRAMCRGRLYEPEAKISNGAGVVLAHGLCGTMDSGLLAYAEGFAKAGFHALVFDYRGFGLSEGAPRQYINVAMQRADWQAAIKYLRGHSEVDSGRIGLWGVSFSGGHVIHLAHEDDKIRGVVGQVPMVDPILSHNLGTYHRGAEMTAAMIAHVLHHAKRRWYSKKVDMLQVAAGDRKKPAVLGSAEADIYPQLAGPSWRNELHPESFLNGKMEDNNASLLTDDLTTPMLLQMAVKDTSVSNEAIRNFVRRCGPLARLSTHEADHFTMLQDTPQQHAAIDEAVGFFRDHLIL